MSQNHTVLELDANHLEAGGIVGFNKKDPRGRPFNLLRTQLMKRMADGGLKLAGLTSATPGAGKSFTAVNLAVSLSQFANMPVILADLDFRRGSVAQYLGLNVQQGLAEVLAGEASLDDIAVRAGVENLIVYPAVAGDMSGSSLMAGKSFGDLIATIRAQVGEGIALFDLPPVFADDDALIATQQLDGYLLVTDSGITPISHVTDSIERLKPSPCLGTILNRHEGSLIDGYRYGYGDYNYNFQ